jgi:short-subunit dehydrogenase
VFLFRSTSSRLLRTFTESNGSPKACSRPSGNSASLVGAQLKNTTREVFETNTFGVMAMTQAVVPQFRERRSGVVVNVTSSVTLTPMPLAAVYTASKMAIEGFTASLALELAAFNVRAKLVEPGYGPTTRFTSNGGPRTAGLIPDVYESFAQPIFAAFAHPAAVTTVQDVAEVVWRAVNDATGQLRFPAGADAVALAESRLEQKVHALAHEG